MAFVFRSEKKYSAPQNQIIQQKQQDQPQFKGVKQGAIFRGLPYLLSKQAASDQKENSMQSIEASPIHPGSYSFNNTAFRLREFNDVKISQYGGEEPEKLQILTVKEIGKKKNEELITFIKNKQANNTVNISCKTLGKITEEKPTIISKNLLKTMLYLSQKTKQQLDIQKIVINESKQKDSLKKNRLREWKSLKKLSPLKDYSKFSQTAETDDINLSCCGLKSNKEDVPVAPTEKKENTMKFNAKKLCEGLQEADEEEDEYDSEATPGPGAYSYEWKNKKQFRSKKKKFQKIFYSQIERFQADQKKKDIGYLTENTQTNEREKSNRSGEKSKPFLSNSPKFPELQQSANPPPGYYETRQSLQHDLVRHILKSSNSTTFISRSPRIFPKKGNDLPGPGSYMLDRSLEKLIQEKNQLSYSFKSHLQRKLQTSLTQKDDMQAPTLFNVGENTNAIHIKQDAILEDYYLSEPIPFLSSTERFPQYKITATSKEKVYPKAVESIPKPSPPKQPFNSSQKRQTITIIGDGVGIGLYNLTKDAWSKKSYNILFN